MSTSGGSVRASSAPASVFGEGSGRDEGSDAGIAELEPVRTELRDTADGF